jgi:hypothetical protein
MLSDIVGGWVLDVNLYVQRYLYMKTIQQRMWTL